MMVLGQRTHGDEDDESDHSESNLRTGVERRVFKCCESRASGTAHHSVRGSRTQAVYERVVDVLLALVAKNIRLNLKELPRCER